MTRSELIEKLSSQFQHLLQKDAELVVKNILDSMSDTLNNGKRIEIRGFGSFSLNKRPARIGRNPKTGEKVHISEKLVPHFKAGKEPVSYTHLTLPTIYSV